MCIGKFELAKHFSGLGLPGTARTPLAHTDQGNPVRIYTATGIFEVKSTAKSSNIIMSGGV